MRRAVTIAAALAVGAAAFLAMRRNAIDAAAMPEAADTGPGVFDAVVEQLPSFDFWTAANQAETEANVTAAANIIDTDANVRAFLQAIARAEGTAGQPDPYRVCYGYRHTVQSLSDHPAITGEWKGERLSDALCAGAGLGPGCVSTAAGKFQITKGTWATLKRRLALRDFSPESQDAAAIELLRESGALQAAQAGDIAAAVGRARRTWASLPGAGYDQPERSLAWVQRQFTDAGGVLA